MGMMPAHTSPAMSIQPASGHIEHCMLDLRKNPVNNITLHKKKLVYRYLVITDHIHSDLQV